MVGKMRRGKCRGWKKLHTVGAEKRQIDMGEGAFFAPILHAINPMFIQIY